MEIVDCRYAFVSAAVVDHVLVDHSAQDEGVYKTAVILCFDVNVRGDSASVSNYPSRRCPELFGEESGMCPTLPSSFRFA